MVLCGISGVRDRQTKVQCALISSNDARLICVLFAFFTTISWLRPLGVDIWTIILLARPRFAIIGMISTFGASLLEAVFYPNYGTIHVALVAAGLEFVLLDNLLAHCSGVSTQVLRM